MNNSNKQQWRKEVAQAQEARQILEHRHHLEECRDLWASLLDDLDSLDPQFHSKAQVFKAKHEALRDLILGLEGMEYQGKHAELYLDGEAEPQKGATV